MPQIWAFGVLPAKMNRDDLKQLAALRRREAKVLLDSKMYPGAYYLIGYAVECALKACIAKQTKRYEFPDRELANSAYTHDLTKLLAVSGLKSRWDADVRGKPTMQVNWLIVKDWSESARYNPHIARVDASDMYSACVSRTNGILNWIAKQW